MQKIYKAWPSALKLCGVTMFVPMWVMGTVCAQTSDSVPDGLGSRWSGFVTLSLTHHANENADVIGGFSQKFPAYKGWSGRLDTAGGLQADLRVSEDTSAAVQAVIRGGDDFKPQLRMAYVQQDVGANIAVRVRRFRSPLFADSDVTEIGFANI